MTMDAIDDDAEITVLESVETWELVLALTTAASDEVAVVSALPVLAFTRATTELEALATTELVLLFMAVVTPEV